MLSSSILIASFRRPRQLAKCLDGIARQTLPPDEVIVVWQHDDEETRELAMHFLPHFEERLKLIHSPIIGIVPAENKGLESAKGEIIVLIDDDAVAPDNWLANHLRHYHDKTTGAVGGPALNHNPSGQRFPIQRVREMGKLKWYGKFVGHLSDSILNDRNQSVVKVDGLAGNNMSFRRLALQQFDENMHDYWQLFELEACQQVRLRGLRVLFDLDNPVRHYPASQNKVYDTTREGNQTQKFFNAAYNHAYILSKYTEGVLRAVRLFYLIAISSIPLPGPIKFPLAVWRYGHPVRELQIMIGTLKAHWEGWQDGKYTRQKCRYDKHLA